MVTKSYAWSNKPVGESFCWNIYCFLLQQDIDWHIFNCRLVAVVGTSRNMTFKFRMTFIFYTEKIRRILKFAFCFFVVYVNLKLLFRYFFMQKKCWHIKGCSRIYTCNLELSLCWQRCKKNCRYHRNNSMSTRETLLLLIACYKWNKYLCTFRI